MGSPRTPSRGRCTRRGSWAGTGRWQTRHSGTYAAVRWPAGQVTASTVSLVECRRWPPTLRTVRSSAFVRERRPEAGVAVMVGVHRRPARLERRRRVGLRDPRRGGDPADRVLGDRGPGSGVERPRQSLRVRVPVGCARREDVRGDGVDQGPGGARRRRRRTSRGHPRGVHLPDPGGAGGHDAADDPAQPREVGAAEREHPGVPVRHEPALARGWPSPSPPESGRAAPEPGAPRGSASRAPRARCRPRARARRARPTAPRRAPARGRCRAAASGPRCRAAPRRRRRTRSRRPLFPLPSAPAVAWCEK